MLRVPYSAHAAPAHSGGVLDALSARSELVRSALDDVKRVHHRTRCWHDLAGGRKVSGEPVHGNDLVPDSEGLVTRAESVGEDFR